ncbi:MAG: cysteinyl-tRNA synthetase [Acidobacteriales bacterium]|nr:cysteinyl-tRNA synthetase [Terriglobales bacterium]
MLRLTNTLSSKTEEFRPLEAKSVGMYSCGPTVYDYGHIGNFRTFVFVDLLRRFLRQSGYKLNHVMNITDVDDKIIRNAAQHKLSVRDYSSKYEAAFLEDMNTLNLQRPEQLVRATDYIQQMAKFIAALEKKGFAYKTDDGSYYFRIAKFPAYGKLSKKDFAGMTDGARVDVDEYEKDNARDFALWKSPKPGEAFWETEIGPGRPGWHIECSVMAREFLGDSFDIHLGGEDLVFPHHENEIAQSESLTGKPFAHFWVHCRFLLVEGEKMSKSLGNFYTLRDLLVMGHKASSIRYLLSSVPYTRQLNFTLDGLKQAAHSVERLRNFKLRLETGKFGEGSSPKFAELAQQTIAKMQAGLDDDMNTAVALAAVFDMVREVNAAADTNELKQGDTTPLLSVLKCFDEIFDVIRDGDAEKSRAAMEWARSAGKISAEQAAALEHTLSDAQVEELIADRNQAKRSRDFAKSDAIRDQLAEGGIILEDTKDGVRWKRK